MNIVFMGTPDFSAAILKRILQDGHTVSGVFTQADKPKGRHMVLTPSPVKVFAQEHDIPVAQPLSLKHGEAMEALREWNPDLIVAAAYGMLLKKDVLSFPKYGCINVHASLLPKYRGAAPINAAILNGEKETGVTTMQMDEGLDTGCMLLSQSTAIGENETAGELFERLAVLGGDVLSETIEQVQNGTLHPVPQNEADMTYAPMLSKKDSPIDWSQSAQEIHDQVRGLSPWPTASTVLNGAVLKIHRAALAGIPSGSCTEAKAGKAICRNDVLYVCCGDGKVLALLEVQLQGSRRMAIADFLRGHSIAEGTVLG